MRATSSATASSIRFSRSGKSTGERPGWSGMAAIGLLVGFTFAPQSLSAQQVEPAEQSGHRIALVDVTYLLKNVPAIKDHVSKVKADRKKEQEALKQRRAKLNQAAEQLKALKVGSAEYNEQEAYLAQLDSQFRLHQIHKHREIGAAEAKLYYDSYQQIRAATEFIATKNNIHLVLNFTGEEMDLAEADSVARGVAKNVIYHDSTINITNAVMRYLEQQANARPVAAGGKAEIQRRSE